MANLVYISKLMLMISKTNLKSISLYLISSSVLNKIYKIKELLQIQDKLIL